MNYLPFITFHMAEVQRGVNPPSQITKDGKCINSSWISDLLLLYPEVILGQYESFGLGLRYHANQLLAGAGIAEATAEAMVDTLAAFSDTVPSKAAITEFKNDIYPTLWIQVFISAFPQGSLWRERPPARRGQRVSEPLSPFALLRAAPAVKKGGVAPSTFSPSRAAGRYVGRGGRARRSLASLFRIGRGKSVLSRVQCRVSEESRTTTGSAPHSERKALWLSTVCTI